MQAKSIYERNDALDVDLGLDQARVGAPPVWSEKCTGLVDKIRRVVVAWQKGGSTYEPIPDAVIEVPPLDKEDRGETSTDLRFSEPGKWGRELADRAWAFALEHAEKNGPTINAQLILMGFEEKTGLFRPLAGGVSAKKCPGTRASARDRHEEGGDPRDRVIDHLLEAIDRRDMRVERMADKITNIAGGVEKVMGVCFRVAATTIELTNNVSAAAQAERQSERDLIIRIVQMQTTGETIRDVIKEVAPGVSDFLSGMGAPGGSYATIASRLLKSITDDQRAKASEAGAAELVADLEKILRKLAGGVDDQEAVALMTAIAPRMNEHQGTLGPILTEKQRGLVLALFKLADLVV